MKTLYQCKNCGNTHESRQWIFRCWKCDAEICEDCMYGWETCKECGSKTTNAKLRARFERNMNA